MNEARTLVERVRGQGFRGKVAASLLPEKELGPVLEKKLTEDLPVPFAVYGEALVAAGLIDDATNLKDRILKLYTSQVAGFYDPAEKRYYLVPERSSSMTGTLPGAEGVGISDIMEKALLAHELTHALQDQRLNLDRRMKRLVDDTDGALALQCVLEGEATVVMAEALVAGLPVEARGLVDMEPLLASLGSLSASSVAGVEDVPDYFVKQLVFPYAAGTKWIDAVKKKGGWAALDARYALLPQTTAEILRPGERLPPRKRLSPRPTAADLPKPVTFLFADTLGEWVLRFLLEKGKNEEPEALGSEWQDDRILFFRRSGDEPQRVGFLWRIQTRSEAGATRLAKALESVWASRTPGLRPAIGTLGSLVEISLGALPEPPPGSSPRR